MISKKLSPVHPGEILQKEFLEPMGLSQNKLAMALHVPARRINEIVLGKRGVTADTAVRLSRYFGMSPQFWLGLQMDYELDVAEDSLEGRIEKEVVPMSALLTEEYFEARAKRASLKKFRKVLKKVPDSEPEDYDRI